MRRKKLLSLFSVTGNSTGLGKVKATVLVAMLLLGSLAVLSMSYVKLAAAQPSNDSVYNAIQYAYEYLIRLAKVNPGGSAALSEYAAMPLSIEYTVSSTQEGWAAAGLNNTAINGESIGSWEQDVFEYTLTGYCYNGLNLPDVRLTVNTSWPNAATELVYVKLDAMDSAPCTINLWWGQDEFAKGVTSADDGVTWALTVNLGSFYVPSGGSDSNGFDFSEPASNFVTNPVAMLGSMRYTTRSGLQSEWKWSEAGVLNIEGTGYDWLGNTVLNELNSLGFTGYYGIMADTYEPSWFYGESLPYNYQDNGNSGGTYQDCYKSGPVIFGNSGYGTIYPYKSEICLDLSLYLSYVWGSDPLVMGETAVQVLNQYGPSAADVYWHGSYVSPEQFAADLYTQGWVTTTGPYPASVYYPTATTSLSPNTGVGSGVRTAVAAELYTLLAYKYGVTSYDGVNFETLANDLVQTLIDTQWGVQTGYSSGLPQGVDYAENSGTCYVFSRPGQTGGAFVGWNMSSSVGCEEVPSDWFTSVIRSFGMPAEFQGIIATNQETTQAYLAALLTYFNLVVLKNDPTINMGVQPFINYVFEGTGHSVVTHTFTLNGLYPSGTYTLYLNVINEGDAYLRDIYVYLNGNQIYSGTVTGGVDQLTTITVNLGTLSSTALYTLGIELTTYNTQSPSDWWIVDAAIEDPSGPQYAFFNIPNPVIAVGVSSVTLTRGSTVSIPVEVLNLTQEETPFGLLGNYGYLKVATNTTNLMASVTPLQAQVGAVLYRVSFAATSNTTPGRYTAILEYVFGDQIVELPITLIVT